jgi:hypothetical protein
VKSSRWTYLRAAEGPEKDGVPGDPGVSAVPARDDRPGDGAKSSDAGQGKREGKFYLSHGYVLVQADMRGTGASTGHDDGFHAAIAAGRARAGQLDRAAAVVRRPRRDEGLVVPGVGRSWRPRTKAPKALKCIVPQCVPLDGYTGEAYPGGIFLQGFFDRFTPFMKA